MKAARKTFAAEMNSKTIEEASKNVIRLYRNSIRSIPHIIRIYNLELNASEIKQQIKKEFLKNSSIKDPQIIDMLVFKGNSELEETKLQWKTKTHVIRFLMDERAGRSPAELQKITKKNEEEEKLRINPNNL